MKWAVAIAAVAIGAAIIAAGPENAAVDVRSNMVEGVNPAALAIWDVGNAAMDESGRLNPPQMDTAAWAKLQEAAQSLGTYAHRLAAAEAIRASGPDLAGGKVPEGVSTREQIQAMIDANPVGFRAAAAAMEEQSKTLAAAAARRDLKAAGELIGSFDQACQGCHENYWYPKP